MHRFSLLQSSRWWIRGGRPAAPGTVVDLALVETAALDALVPARNEEIPPTPMATRSTALSPLEDDLVAASELNVVNVSYSLMAESGRNAVSVLRSIAVDVAH